MTATLRIRCTYGAPEGWQWAAEINKEFRHPTAIVDGEETELNWEGPTDIKVAPGQPHHLGVFIRVLGLHWCGDETETNALRDGETQAYEYCLEARDRWMNRGHLTRSI